MEPSFEVRLTNVLNQVLIELRQRKLTISFAESCSGGLLSAKLTEIPGVSDVFLGSVVSYANTTKADLLGVSWEALNSEGAVSENVARQMAKGCLRSFKTSCSIAITGIAGPGGGSPQKPVGTVWFAVSGPHFDISEKKNFSGDRVEIQRQSVEWATKLLLRGLQHK